MPRVQVSGTKSQISIGVITVLMVCTLASEQAKAKTPARLVVMLVIDQFGANYLDRWRPYLKGGVDTLIRRGAFYRNGVHRYANTATCPGHATIMTGAWPSVHGIVNNKWFEGESLALRTCTHDEAFGHSPSRRMAPSFGDQLNEVSKGKSKTVTISMKPRVAVISAPRTPEAAVWYDRKQGKFVGGQWYGRAKAPPWVDRINRERNPALSFGAKWNRFASKLNYEQVADKDDRPYEFDVPGLGRTFPKVYGQGLKGPNHKWFGSYRGTPHALETTFALAKAAIDAEGMGQDEYVDFLMVGVSNLDLIGHWYGPHSQEALDMTLRIDAQIKSLMQHVESKFGRDNTIWVLTADHGVVPTPEASQRFGLDATRVDTAALKNSINAKISKLFKKTKNSPKVKAMDPPFFVIDLGSTKGKKDGVLRTAVKALNEHPDIAEAYLAENIDKMQAPYRLMYKRMIYPGRSSKILIRSHPHDWIDSGHWTTGTGHGSPYTYDTHVPIIFAGPRIAHGRSTQTYDVTRIVPTLSALLNMSAPAAALDAPLPAAGQ